MSLLKRLTGLTGNGILILFLVYISMDFFHWLGSCLFYWEWREPSITSVILLMTIASLGLIMITSYIIGRCGSWK